MYNVSNQTTFFQIDLTHWSCHGYSLRTTITRNPTEN